MRKFTILLAAAPLAMLAACGEAETDADMTDADATTVATSDNDPTAAGDYTPGPATALADAGDISGGYTYTAEDGTSRSVKIDASNKSYTYYGPDGITRTGDYTWTPDGFRLMLPDFDGTQSWFVVREGSLVRLNEDKKWTPEMTVEGDRYARDDDNAVFSREPELGSPVAPQD